MRKDDSAPGPTQLAASQFRGLCAAIGLALAASACTTTSDPFEALVLPGVPASSQLPYGDYDPVNFGVRHPGRYPVHGVDVSRYQDAINWRVASRAGISFAAIKATEGGDRLDERFNENWRGARRAGIPHTAYHFYYFCTPARVQAAWFIANVPKTSIDLPPILDMEWNPNSPTCTLRPEPRKVRREMKIWLDMVERHYGKRPIIYTSLDFHGENLDGYFKNYQFWLRSVAAHPSEAYPDHHWTFWQYTGTGQVPGIEGPADINAFAGTRAEWQEWLKEHAD